MFTRRTQERARPQGPPPAHLARGHRRLRVPRGVFVFTDTIRGSFDRLFANAYENTDAYVRSSNVIEGDFGDESRDRIDDSLIADGRRDARASARPSATCRASPGSPTLDGRGPRHRRPAEVRRRLRSARAARRGHIDRGRAARSGPTRSSSTAARRSRATSRSATQVDDHVARRRTPSSPSSASRRSPAPTPPAARRGRCSTCRPRRSSCIGEPGKIDSIVVRSDGSITDEELADRRPGAVRRRRGRGAHRRRDHRREPGRHRGGAQLLHDLPHDLRRHLAVRRQLHHLQRVQHQRRPAPAGERAAARHRRQPPPGHPDRCSSRRWSSASLGGVLGFAGGVGLARADHVAARARRASVCRRHLAGRQPVGVRHHPRSSASSSRCSARSSRPSAPVACRRSRRCATSRSTAPACRRARLVVGARLRRHRRRRRRRSGSPATPIWLGARRRRAVRLARRARTALRRAGRPAAHQAARHAARRHRRDRRAQRRDQPEAHRAHRRARSASASRCSSASPRSARR